MLINNKQTNLYSHSQQRYAQTVFNSEPYKSIDVSIKKGQSADKMTNSPQIRQTMQMKRYKYQKMVFQSKPLSIHNFYQNFFAVEPNKAQILSSSNISSEMSNEYHNKVLPISSSNWVANSKKIQTRWLAGKRGISFDSRGKKQKPERRFEFELNSQAAINDIRQYFYSMKQFLNNHKKKVQKQRKIRVISKNQTKRQFQQKDNLSIIRLNPFKSQKNKDRKTQQQQFSYSPQLVQHYSTNHISNSRSKSRQTSFSIKSHTAQRFKKTQTNLFKKLPIKKQDYHYIFGKIKDSMKQQQINQLKALYYYDFIWKIWYNRGFKYQNNQQIFKYYVGKGNNSRLIRRIMSKRTWWIEESKQQNAHFIWTQLKIYQIYKNQKSSEIDSNFIIKDTNVLLTTSQNPQNKISNIQIQQIQPDKNYIKQDKNSYILNKKQYKNWRKYISSRGGFQRKPKQNMKQRNLAPKLEIKSTSHKMTNHLQFSRVIGNKKALYRTMEAYFNYRQIQSYLPLTFHITEGLEDQQYLKFLRQFYKKSKEGLNCWIVKPGQLSNRGKDIKYCRNLKQIKDAIKQRKTNSNGSLRTYIVQSYIQRPFLYQNRKFDLRHYLMITSTQGKIRGYFYQEGYVRTTSYPYSLDNQQSSIHLTNDAIQKYLPQYGKFQKANKLSYQQLNQYMLKINTHKGFYDCIFPQLKKISTQIIHASFPFIDPQRRNNNFQIFGIDVMIDSNYQCWLIQVNTNPCIQVNCTVLANIIPQMLDNAFTIGLDSLICPPQGKIKLTPNNYLQSNKFELVFDQQIDGQKIITEYKILNIDIGNFGDDDDNYQSCQEQDYQS